MACGTPGPRIYFAELHGVGQMGKPGWIAECRAKIFRGYLTFLPLQYPLRPYSCIVSSCGKFASFLMTYRAFSSWFGVWQITV